MYNQDIIRFKKSGKRVQLKERLMYEQANVVGKWQEYGMHELCSHIKEWRIKEALFSTSLITRSQQSECARRHPRDQVPLPAVHQHPEQQHLFRGGAEPNSFPCPH